MAKQKGSTTKTASGADVVVRQDDKVAEVATMKRLKRDESGVWGKPRAPTTTPRGECIAERKNGRWIGTGKYVADSQPGGEKLAERVDVPGEKKKAVWVAPPAPTDDDDD